MERSTFLKGKLRKVAIDQKTGYRQKTSIVFRRKVEKW